MAITLYVSNRLEALLEALAGTIEKTPLPPMTPEWVVVLNQGMERWLSLRLAERHGIASNYRFPFPNHLFDRIVQCCLGFDPDPSPFDPGLMQWQLMKLLGERKHDEAFAPLTHYLGDDPAEEITRRYQLAGQIARVYDHYLTYRPELILEWEKHPERHGWQSQLWNQLIAALNTARHRPGNFQKLRAWLDGENTIPVAPLPARISIFGITALSPLHLHLIAAVSHLVPVHFYLLNPCRYYWGDVLSRSEQRRLLRHVNGQILEIGDQHLENQHPLLISWGEQWRDFIDLVLDTFNEPPIELFVDPCNGGRVFQPAKSGGLENPPSVSRLHHIQADLLDLIWSEIASKEAGTPTNQSADDSIQIHQCHSPRREVEILHDNLLRLFSRHDDLTPREIIVLCPDVDGYAPAIEAVFENRGTSGATIPYNIADRSRRWESAAVNAFITILELAPRRITAPAVINLLGITAIQDRFDIASSDVEVIQQWLEETHIHWGWDGDQQDYHNHTWSAGLKRLLMGYAMGEADDELVQGILPYPRIAESQWDLVDRLLAFVEKFFAILKSLNQPHCLDEWSRILSEVVDDFLAFPDQQNPDCLLLKRACGSLLETMAAASFSEPLPLTVIFAVISDYLERPRRATRFMAGGVTICRLIPMRSVPFRVVYLLGMNEGAFPRQDRSPSFDLLSLTKRKGDRSKRGDDRQLFLEALLSARQYFMVSYVGWDARDGNEKPPSIVVGELIDYLASGPEMSYSPNHRPDHQHGLHTPYPWFLRHALQSYDPAYFQAGTGLFSYCQDDYVVAVNLTAERQTSPAPLWQNKLTELSKEERSITAMEFARFLENPARVFLQRRCRLNLDIEVTPLADREPFQINGLAGYAVKQDLLNKSLTVPVGRDWLTYYQQTGWLPQGELGTQHFRRVEKIMDGFTTAVREEIHERSKTAVEVELEISGFLISGRITGVYDDRLIQAVPVELKGRYVLRLWLSLLLAQASGAQLAGGELLYLHDGQTKSCHVQPPEKSQEILSRYLECFREGMRRPLPFFPECAFAYMKKWQETSDHYLAVTAARKVWRSSFQSKEGWSGQEGDDVWMERCFRRQHPIADEFVSLTHTIMDPLWAHLEYS